jgi:hypothetical protein
MLIDFDLGIRGKAKRPGPNGGLFILTMRGDATAWMVDGVVCWHTENDWQKAYALACPSHPTV